MDQSNDEATRNSENLENPEDDIGELTSDCNKDKFMSVNLDDGAATKEKLVSDPNKVTFKDMNVDVHVGKTTVGMSKAELMKYANDPFWVRLRMILFVSFWIAWFSMLVGAIVIILLNLPPHIHWYHKTVMYQVDVKTFKDSDGDGIGDFKGLISKLDYFKTQRIGTLMLSSFYESSDNDDAITDHKKINSKVGTISDFEELLSQLKEKDIKLVIDFNPNHSSDQHQWFIDSVEKTEPYDDFYIWSDAENNSLSIDGRSAWTWNAKRQQYYLSTFGEGKPDLNLRNLQVRDELKNILRFWLEKGIHGVKVVAASHLVGDEDLIEKPMGTTKTPAYKDLNPIYTLDKQEKLDLFAEWRGIVSNFSTTGGLSAILIAEVSGSLPSTVSYYKNGNETLADLAFNTQMTEISEDSTPLDLKEKLESWSKMSDEVWPTYLVGSSQTRRLANRVGDDLVDAMHMVTILAKGTPITYYGDELGMGDLSGSKENGMLPRSVMLWSNKTNAGFTNGSNSVKIQPNYETINVQSQGSEEQSHLNIFKSLLTLKGKLALSLGLQDYPIVNNETFSMIRFRKGCLGYLVVVNFSTNATAVDFTGTSEYFPDVARVQIRSRNLKSGPLADGGHPNIPLKDVPLGPKQSVVFSFESKVKG